MSLRPSLRLTRGERRRAARAPTGLGLAGLGPAGLGPAGLGPAGLGLALLALVTLGCDDKIPGATPSEPSAPAASPAKPDAEPPGPALSPEIPGTPLGAIPTPEDLEEEAERTVVIDNLEAELDRLEAEIGAGF